MSLPGNFVQRRMGHAFVIILAALEAALAAMVHAAVAEEALLLLFRVENTSDTSAAIASHAALLTQHKVFVRYIAPTDA